MHCVNNCSRNAVHRARELEKELNETVKILFDKSLSNFDANNKETYFDFAYDFIRNKNNKTPINESELLMDFRILIQASIDTMSFVIIGGLLYLIQYKDIQTKLYNELSIAFKDGKIKLKNLTKCPYFRAYIQEVLRLALPVPSGVPRWTTKDIPITFTNKYTNKQESYVVPKNSMVSFNMPSINSMDKDKWGTNPNEMNLNNWLINDNNGNILFRKKHDIYPFSIGMRNCVGMSLALRLINMILGTMILKYEFNNVDNKPFKVEMEFTHGDTPKIKSSKIIIKHRQ